MRLIRKPIATRVSLSALVIGMTLLVSSNIVAAGASSLPTATVKVAPTTLSTTVVTPGYFTVNFVSGGDGASFDLEVNPPQWPDRRVVGSPLSLGDATISGPGSIGSGPITPGDPVPGSCTRGSSGSAQSYHLEMPGSATSTLRIPLELTGTPWSLKPLQASMRISADGEFARVKVPPIQLGGPIAPWVKIDVQGKRGVLGYVGKSVKKPITLIGKATVENGSLRGKKVQLVAVPISAPGAKRKVLGKVTLKRGGTFAKRVVLRTRGTYQIRGRILGSQMVPSCGLLIQTD